MAGVPSIPANNAIPPGSRIYVAGHRGLVGSALVRRLLASGHSRESLLLRTRDELDLRDTQAVRTFFDRERPEFIFLAAAKVGGIQANVTYPAEFIHTNLAIQTNVIDAAWRSGVSRLLFLGSSCIYPRDCPQPIREDYLLTGPLESSNRAYAVAKIAGIEMCAAYNRQYGTKYLSVMPTNCYGPGDSHDLQNSHVLPALIRKMHDAKAAGDAGVTVWGSGLPRREFIYSDDLADGCIFLMSLPEEQFVALAAGSPAVPVINIGVGEDLTIRQLAHEVAEVVGFRGDLVFDRTKPDGTPRKLLDCTRMLALGWRPKVSLRQGIAMTYDQYAMMDATPARHYAKGI